MRLKLTSLPLVCGLALTAVWGVAHAETADRSKPIEINADNFLARGLPHDHCHGQPRAHEGKARRQNARS